MVELEELSIDPREYGSKNPAVAGSLSLLPGGGNFYLRQFGIAILNLITWPFSIVWAIPQTVIDATNINIKQTVLYFRTKKGRESINKIKAELKLE